MSKVKTITATTTEQAITFDATYQFVWFRSLGDGDVLVSDHSGIVAGTDDVALVKGGDSTRITVPYNKTVYVKAVSDSVDMEIHAQNFSDAPFAWNEAGGGSDVSVVSLSVDDNGTYTAPSGTAYSPVSVNVPIGAEIITRSDWNALTTAQKQAKGLVAIQDASTGFMRGEFVNGADYHDTLLQYSTYSSILEEAKCENHTSGTDVWGGLTLSGNMDNDVDGGVVTDGKVISKDFSDSNVPVTVYALMRKNASPSGNKTLIGIPYSMSGNNCPNIFTNGTTVYTSVYGSDSAITGISSANYNLFTIALDATNKKADFYVNGNLVRNNLSYNSSGGYAAFGAGDKSLTNVISSAIKYIAIVSGYETSYTITNNHRLIMDAYNL